MDMAPEIWSVLPMVWTDSLPQISNGNNVDVGPKPVLSSEELNQGKHKSLMQSAEICF